MGPTKTVWINQDLSNNDLGVLVEGCAQRGYRLIAKRVANTPECVVQAASEADVIISTMETWNEETLSALRGKNKLIMRFGVGIDTIDLDAATRYGVPVANTPGANAEAVAEVALLHILNLCRNFTDELSSIRANQWGTGRQGTELDGKTLGLIGYGNIARQLVRMVSGFRLTVLAYDPFVNDNIRLHAAENNVRLVETMEEVFAAADIISLHMPLTRETQGSINKRLFDLMKPTAFLINTCRGGVINEEDFIQALNCGRIRAAGIDVVCHERCVDTDPIFKAKNLYITPHIAASTEESIVRSQECFLQTIDAFFNGELPYNVLNRRELT